MPTKRTRRTRTPKGLSQEAIVYLMDYDVREREGLDNFTLECYRMGEPGFDHLPGPDELWREHGDKFLPEYIKNHPCKRPRAWWHWEAPRLPDQGSGFWYEGSLPEPRKRIGGQGELQKGYVPDYSYGIPHHWDPATVNPQDPPVFESQASYLLRHGLLSETEKKYLAEHGGLMEPEIITLEQ